MLMHHGNLCMQKPYHCSGYVIHLMQPEFLAHFLAQPGLCLGTRPPTNSINHTIITLCKYMNLQQEVRMVGLVARPVHSSTPYYSVHCDLYCMGLVGFGMEMGMAWN